MTAAWQSKITMMINMHRFTWGYWKDVKIEKVAVNTLGLSNGRIVAMYSDYLDGLELEYEHAESHTIRGLYTFWRESGKDITFPLIWESDLDGRHFSIFSKEDVQVVWQLDKGVVLSHSDFAWNRCLSGHMIQKAVRQFKGLTLEKYATMVNAAMLDILAAFQRMGVGLTEKSISGEACYLFLGDCKLTTDNVRASAMRRDELEGVMLLATPYGDYSLKTSEGVKHSLGEGGIWHIDANGETEKLRN